MKSGLVKELLLCRNVYSMAFEAALRIFELSQGFPKGGPKSLYRQIIQYSSAVCESLREAWQNRKRTRVFVDKLNNAAIHARKTQNQIEFALDGGILETKVGEKLNNTYEDIINKITSMIENTGKDRVTEYL